MKSKVVRVIAGLLCAVTVFSNVAGMCVYAMEDGAGQEVQMQESVSGNDGTEGEAESTEQSKDTEEQGDSDGSEDTEASDDQEDTEEPGADGTEEKDPDGENKDKAEDPEGPAEETELMETEKAGMMLFSARAAGEEVIQDADSTYTDENGVIYHYYGYDDGTAKIYELESCQESTWDYKALNIPFIAPDSFVFQGRYYKTRQTYGAASFIQRLASENNG